MRTVQVGLTGGIGAGKSTVAQLLAAHGALVLDADRAAREVVAPGTEGFAAVVARFGPQVVTPQGELDRAALARLVFVDEDSRRALDAIVHPRVRTLMSRWADFAAPGTVVVHDIPLLVESGLTGKFAFIVVVDAPEELRIERLVRHRAMSQSQARARIAAQATRAQRLAVADAVITNDGPMECLSAQVDQVWSRIRALCAVT